MTDHPPLWQVTRVWDWVEAWSEDEAIAKTENDRSGRVASVVPSPQTQPPVGLGRDPEQPEMLHAVITSSPQYRGARITAMCRQKNVEVLGQILHRNDPTLCPSCRDVLRR